MEVKDYLLDELKRLNRINDILEKEFNKSNNVNLAIGETIQKNTSAMCEITKVL